MLPVEQAMQSEDKIRKHLDSESIGCYILTKAGCLHIYVL